MTKQQSQKLAMYMAVLRLLRNQENPNVAAAALEPMIAELERFVAAIQHTSGQRRLYSKGLHLSKLETLENLRYQLYTVAEAIRAYAGQAGDNTLASRFRFSRSQLRRIRQVELPSLAAAVLDQARALDAALQPFGVTPDTLDVLETTTADFRDLLSQPRHAQVRQGVVTEDLAALFAGADTLLYDKVDPLLNTQSGTELHRAYKRARRLFGARRAGSDTPFNTPEDPDGPMLLLRAPMLPAL